MLGFLNPGIGWEVELLAKITADLKGNVVNCRQIAQVLMALEEREERELLGSSSGMGQGKLSFFIGWIIQGMEFLKTQRGFEARVGGAFD